MDKYQDISVEFNPLNKIHKSITGGVQLGQSVNFKLNVSTPQDSNADKTEKVKKATSVPKGRNGIKVELVLTKEGENSVSYDMDKVSSNSKNDSSDFACNICVTTKGLYFYIFKVTVGDKSYFIGSGEKLMAVVNSARAWQLTVYDTVVAPPSWLKGGLFYQIMPDRFFIGGDRLKTRSDCVYRNDWLGVPQYKADDTGRVLNNDFFGGNLKGITKKLGYLKSLGVTCIYLNPIFKAYSNHKYDTGDYRKVDPDFGTVADLQDLIKKADRRGMKIMLDGVFSHTGSDSIYFNRYGKYDSVGAYQSEDSPYSSWYNFHNFPYNYDAWWGFDTLPNANEIDKHYKEFILGESGVIDYWTSLGIGGWRLDVADELPNSFLDGLHNRIKKVNREAVLLGEVWEDASKKTADDKRRRYLLGGQLDSVTNYPFKEDILHFIKTGDAKRLSHTIAVIVNNYPKHALDNLMNLLGTHDTKRLATELGEYSNSVVVSKDKRAKAKMNEDELKAVIEKIKLAAVLQYTLVGVPSVYYGDEVALQGFEDPFNRRCYPWGELTKFQKKLLSFYRKLGKVRKENIDIFSDGEFELLKDSNGIFAFKRISGDNEIVIVVNNSDKEFEFKDTVGAGVLDRPKNKLPQAPKMVIDLLTKKEFGEIIKPFSAVVLGAQNIKD